MKSKLLTVLMILLAVSSILFAEDRYDTGCYAHLTVPADVNNDGYVDLLQSHGYDYFFSIFMNKGDGTFYEAARFDYLYNDSCYIAPADVNNDNWVDMVVSYLNAPYLLIYFNKGDGTFEEPTTYDAAGSHNIIIEDINNDNWLDIVVCHGSPKNVMQVLMNNGDGTFADIVKYKREEFYVHTSHDAGDVDNDGFLDIVTTYLIMSSDDRFIEVYKNNGDGTFGDPVLYDPETKGALYITVADVNNDHYVDILGSQYNNQKLSVFLNNGDGTFADPDIYDTGAKPFSPTVADINNDGWNEILVNNYGGDTVSVFMNKGDGTFENEVKCNVAKRPNMPTLFDIDNDGWIDMIVPSRDDGSINVFLNKKDGTFGDSLIYGPGDSYEWVTIVADVNNDLLVDIIQTDLGSANLNGFISVFKNLGNGRFDNVGIRLRLEYDTSGDETLYSIMLNLCSYPDRAVNVDLYFVMVDPDGNVYSGLDWNEGLKPLARNLTVPSNTKIDNLTLLDFTFTDGKLPFTKSGTHLFAMAMFKTGTTEMIMFLTKTGLYVKLPE